ncbi:MAG: hypothetical protein P4L84_13345 [Isosphaeraceae bacterium]|nr:hypothetical protein [Isosphaeraceae bacterium]
MTPRLAVLIAAGLLVHASNLRGAGPDDSHRAEPIELVLLGGERPLRVLVWAEIDGQPVSAIWDESLGRLFAYHDRDKNDVLDTGECARLPAPFALRQVLWGQIQPLPGSFFDPSGRDRAPGRMELDGLTALYHRAGLGNVLVGAGKPPATALLTDAVLKHLDRNGDHRVDEMEWRAAPVALRSLDWNDDELIGPGELVHGASYPGAMGTTLLSAPRSDDPPAAEVDPWPVLVLPSSDGSPQWSVVLTQRLDRDGDGGLNAAEAAFRPTVFSALDSDKDDRLTPAELSAWRRENADAAWRVHLGKRRNGQAAVEAISAPSDRAERTSRVRWELHAAEGQLADSVTVARKYYQAWFTDADANADGVLEKTETTDRKQSRVNIASVVAVADSDGDGRLNRCELTAWLDLQEQVARGHVLLTALDHGPGLFELLDADRNGALSVRELRGAWDRLGAEGCLRDGALDRGKLPRQWVFIVSRGHPLPGLARVDHGGPGWFRAMDRNGDGDLSPREFVGPRTEFQRLDGDGDGLISPSEAGTRQQSQQKVSRDESSEH